MQIGDRVKERRMALGLSQTRLAELAGGSQQSINHLEGGNVQRPRNILALARALQCSPEWLLGETAAPPSTPSVRSDTPAVNTDVFEPQHNPALLLATAHMHFASGRKADAIAAAEAFAQSLRRERNDTASG